uniref:Uncharacterized protein n=1 Tax=Anguilla anguilla TaxID=7936 RepID=A0A0E9QF57_ANGAN
MHNKKVDSIKNIYLVFFTNINTEV